MHNHNSEPRPSSDSRRGARLPRRGLLALLCLAQLMVILDISAVNVALPDLAQDLGLDGGALSWTITSYSLVFGSLLLLGGRAADMLGRRRMFLAGLGVFTLASVGSALAGSAAALFAARAGQGIGAAMLSPAALSIITSTFTDGAERARALGVWGAIGGAGAAIGVLLGGVLTELVDWRAIFFINAPIGIAVGVLAFRVIPAQPARPQWRALDVRGAVLATVSVAALVYAFSQAQSAGWISVQTLGIGSLGLAGVAAFAAFEARASLPLLRVQRLADRAIGGGFAMMLTGSALLFGSFLLTSLYLQDVLGATALETGLAFLPLALVTGAGAHIGTQLITQRGVRLPLAGGFATVAIGMLLLSGVSSRGTYAGDVLPGMLIVGLGLGVILVAVAVSVLTGARDGESGMLSGLNTTGHEVGGSLGLAVLTTVAMASVGSARGPAAGGRALASGIGNAYTVAAVIAALASVAAVIILPAAKRFLPKLALAPRVSIH